MRTLFALSCVTFAVALAADVCSTVNHQTKKEPEMKESLNTTRPAVANRATSAIARRMRRTVQRGLAGPALEMAQAIDFDKLADLWSDLDRPSAGRRRR